MPELPLVLAGKVYLFDSSTPVENVDVTIVNVSTNESHNGNDTKFVELTTNAQGEFQANLANFDQDHTSGDEYLITINHAGLKDVVTVTVTDSHVVNIVLMPTPVDVYEYERSLDEIGNKVSIYDTNPSFDKDHGSITRNSKTLKDFGEDIFASIQAEEDEETQEEEGVVSKGVFTGYFKVRYSIGRDDIIVSGSDEFRVADKPKKWMYKNVAHHYEVRLTRINV